MCIFYILRDTQTLSFLFPRKQPPNPFQWNTEQFSFHYAKMITIIQKVLPGRMTSFSENNALKSIMYNYLFQKENGIFFSSLFYQLRSRTSRTFSAKHVGRSKLTISLGSVSFDEIFRQRTETSKASWSFHDHSHCAGYKAIRDGFYPVFPLEDPTLASNHGLHVHRQKKIQKKKIPNQVHRLQSEKRFSKTIAGRVEINQNPLFLAKENICTPISFAQEHCND